MSLAIGERRVGAVEFDDRPSGAMGQVGQLPASTRAFRGGHCRSSEWDLSTHAPHGTPREDRLRLGLLGHMPDGDVRAACDVPEGRDPAIIGADRQAGYAAVVSAEGRLLAEGTIGDLHHHDLIGLRANDEGRWPHGEGMNSSDPQVGEGHLGPSDFAGLRAGPSDFASLRAGHGPPDRQLLAGDDQSVRLEVLESFGARHRHQRGQPIRADQDLVRLEAGRLGGRGRLPARPEGPHGPGRLP